MENIELNSAGGSTRGQMGSGSTSTEYEEAARGSVPSVSATVEQALGGNDGGSTHSSLRSIASRMQAIFRLFLRATTWVEIATSTVLFTFYLTYWLCFRTTACLFLSTDIPARCPPFNHSSCQYPPPLGSNQSWRPQFALLKIITLAALLYLIFLMANICQLEVVGRWALTGQCVLALTNCRRNFLIYDEVYNISHPQFNLINHLLSKHFMQIANGSLVVIPNPPQIINMSNPTTFQPMSQTKGGQEELSTPEGNV